MNLPPFNAFNHPFWRYSLAFYEQPRVQELCLALQDEHDLDVNLLLFACWLGRQSRRLTSRNSRLEQVRRWQAELVRPLRELRRGQAKQYEAGRRLRRMLQETELKAEQCEQWLLFQAVDAVSSAAEGTALQLTWDNLLDAVADSDQPDKTLLQRLRELAELNRPNPDDKESAPPQS